ncbi:MAG: AMP-binding protein [Acidobacteriota bacterium]|nr:AMP-binding protein [Acidobacteriota bacterium]
MDGRVRPPSPRTLRSWHDHLAPGAAFDPAGVEHPGGLPALWTAAWAGSPRTPLLLEVSSGPDGGRWVTAGELDDRSGRAAEVLGGWAGGGGVVLWSPTRTVGAVVSHVGALRAGLTVVPCNPEATARELGHVVEDVRPAVAVAAGPDQARVLAACGVPVVADHGLGVLDRSGAGDGGDGSGRRRAIVPGGLVGYTSGTTGAPKGAMLGPANLLANSRALAAAWGWTGEDRLVHALPLFHGHGLCAGLYTSLLAGGSVVLLPSFDVGAVIEAAADHGASMFFGVPTMYHRIAGSGRAGELRSLRLAVSGSAPLAGDLQRSLRADGVDVLERYGMTETLLTVSNPLEGERRAGTVGFPLPGVEARVEEESGELLVRGPQVFAGYLGRPEATAAAFTEGWFRTGDLAEVDDGYLRILGRSGDVVISGGFNVYPAEVEEVLARHPGVAEVAVAGTPSEEWGEVVTAWVVPAGPVLDTGALVEFAAGELAPYKRPRVVHLVEALPRNAMGKVTRSALSAGEGLA